METKEQKPRYWLQYIRNRIAQNKNFLAFISGQTGSGKSWSTLSICEALDPDFSIDRVVFGGLELMQLINSGKLRSGSAIAFEEAGVEMSNKNWASVTNKMLNYLLQTFRHRNFILIMNSPFMDFVDASTRKLFHAEMQTAGIDRKQSECILKPQLLQYNSRIQKFYYKRLRVNTVEGVLPINIWRVPKPSTELLEAYEAKKLRYTDALNRRIMQELQQQEAKQKPKGLTEIQQETLHLLQDGYTVDEIAKTRGRAPDVVRSTIRSLRSKGYVIEQIIKNKIVTGYSVTNPDMSDSFDISEDVRTSNSIKAISETNTETMK